MHVIDPIVNDSSTELFNVLKLASFDVYQTFPIISSS